MLNELLEQYKVDEEFCTLLYPEARTQLAYSPKALALLCELATGVCDTAMKRAVLFMEHRGGKTVNETDISFAWQTIEKDEKQQGGGGV